MSFYINGRERKPNSKVQGLAGKKQNITPLIITPKSVLLTRRSVKSLYSMPDTPKRRNDDNLSGGAHEKANESPGQSPKVYADNPKNRQLERVGKPKGSMPDSTKRSNDKKYSEKNNGASEQTSVSPGQSPKVYADNPKNRQPGRKPKGSMPDTTKLRNDEKHMGKNTGASEQTSVSPGQSPKVYACCSPAEFRHSICCKTRPAIELNIQLSESLNTYTNNEFNRNLEHYVQQLGEPKSSMKVLKSECNNEGGCSSRASSPDLGEKISFSEDVGIREILGEPERMMVPRGKETNTGDQDFETDFQEVCIRDRLEDKETTDFSASRSFCKEDEPNTNSNSNETPDTPKSLKPPKCYVDNAQNRRLKRVGLLKGLAVFSKTKKSIGIQYYQDSSLNRRLGRVGLPRGSKPAQKKSSATKKIPEMLSRLHNEQVTNYEELECRGTGHDSDEDSECSMHSSAEAVEKAQLQYNRFLAEKSWKRFSVDPPKTVPSVLKDYVGKKIPFSELKLQRPIGRGGFGEVYFAKWKETVVAVKKMRVENSSEKKIVDFSQEVMKFCTLNHENIVKFIGACVEMPNICIVMEYMQTSLFEAIHSSENIDFSNEERLSILQQTCQGIRYLHSKRIAHCDLKTPNVLLDYVQNELCSVKITDFGLSMVKNDALTSTTNSQELVRNIGTPRFSAPEILRGDLLSAKEMMMADIYSIGLVFFEVIFEEEPFPDYSRDQLKQQVGRLGNKPTVSDMMIDENLQDIMKRAWSYSPRERPKIADICHVVTDCKDIYLKQSDN